MKRSGQITIIIILLINFFLVSCSSEKDKGAEDIVKVHELSDPDMLNPFNYKGAGSSYVFDHIFQSLTGVDYKTFEIVPRLAKSRAEIEEDDQGRLYLTYEIREEARWDNGEPITAKDVEFTHKVFQNPKVDNIRIKMYYDHIDSIIYYDDNPRKLTLRSNRKYILSEGTCGDLPIIPEYIYDPEGLMRKFTLTQINRDNDKLMEDEDIIKFAESFNSEKYQREKGYIVGALVKRL